MLTCGSGSESINQDLLWELTSPITGTLIIDTIGSTFDTKLAVQGAGGCGSR